MALDSATIKTTYPLPAYNYRVTIFAPDAPLVLGFSEVSGLSLDYPEVVYHHGLSFAFGAHIIPGRRQGIRLTMKRGVVKNRDQLYQWLQHVYNDPPSTDKTRNILIDLCDEAGHPVVRWTVQRAMPVKLDMPEFIADNNVPAIETMELVAHGLQLEYDSLETGTEGGDT